MDSPLITVITPTRNRLELLLETMDSVARQTWPRWEHLVVDDGSIDGTAEAVARRSAADDRVRYLSNPGPAAGANVCRNLGIRESRGRYLVFLDSDDLLEPDCLGHRVEVMERNADLDFAVFRFRTFQRTLGDIDRSLDDSRCGDDLLRFLFWENTWMTSSPVWRKSWLVQLGGFDETLPSWQDVELHIRAICAGATYLKFAPVDHHIRWQDEATKISVVQRRSPEHLHAALGIFVKFEELIVKWPGLDWSRQRALCSLYFSVAELWIQQGNLGEALLTWRRAYDRRLASLSLRMAGTVLLALLRVWPRQLGIPWRLAHKWKGWTRLRSNPDLVKKR